MVIKRFSTFYIANTPFWTRKTSILKTHKISIFRKELVHGVGQTLESADSKDIARVVISRSEVSGNGVKKA